MASRLAVFMSAAIFAAMLTPGEVSAASYYSVDVGHLSRAQLGGDCASHGGTSTGSGDSGPYGCTYAEGLLACTTGDACQLIVLKSVLPTATRRLVLRLRRLAAAGNSTYLPQDAGQGVGLMHDQTDNTVFAEKGDGGQGKTKLKDLTITKHIDKSSPTLQ